MTTSIMLFCAGLLVGAAVCYLSWRLRSRRMSRKGRLDLVLENIPGMVVVYTPQGKLVYRNRQVVEYFGFRPEHLGKPPDTQGWELAEVVHPEDREAVVNGWLRSLKTGEAMVATCRMRRWDGTYRWFERRALPRSDDQIHIACWYVQYFDVDDRKRAEDALMASEQKLRLLTEAIPAFVFRNSADGENEYTNQRLLDFIGGSLEDCSGSGWLRRLHPDDLDETRRIRQRALEAGAPYRMLFRLRRADGVYRWFDVRGDPLRDQDGHVLSWYGVLFDIDDSRKIAEELRQTRSKLSRATQLATVAELSASIAHEINQPLAAVAANGEACQTWLSKSPPNIERARLTAERAVRDAKAAAEVVSRIRRLFRQSAPVKTLLDLNGVIREAIDLMSDEISKNAVSAATELDPALPAAMADRVQMQQLLINLISNAIDSMEAALGHSKVLLVRSARDERDAIRIEVQDRGAGISDPESIFDPFFTTKENGMGMGLTICRSIVQAHGGHLWAARNQDVGTTVAFTLPLHQDAAE